MLFGIMYKDEEGLLFEKEFSVDVETEEAGWAAAHEEAQRLTEEEGTYHWVDGMIVWSEKVPNGLMNLYEQVIEGQRDGLH